MVRNNTFTVQRKASLVQQADLRQERLSFNCLKVSVYQYCCIVLKPVERPMLTVNALTSL